MALAASFTLAFPSISLSSRTRISSSGSCYPLRCSIQNSSLSVSVPDTTISKCNETLSAIQNSGIIACLRAESAELAFEAARAALNGGITVLEIVMSNPGVFEVLQQLVHEYPTKIIGVGTVLNLEDAKHAISHGAKFLLSPAMVMGILDDVSCSKALYIPGAMTPTEILSAFSSGAKMIKVYPVSALGGIQYIAALKKPFPHIPLIASQGITVDLVGEYIAHGATSVVLSDAIFSKKAMGERNFETIYQLSRSAASQAIEAVERCYREL
ncbi:uncharacterized protein LOC113757196 isoform X2 [Coffea eugenioides]|uniref:Uncharacterized protein isoform X2 n=1 Tax=Coffea arabica TaxID=13443 RepID=A0A6P6T3M9_COFAR|nr:uncharacterized protein LOC113697359 isoform X2 [Coffea arabica]XP_027156402.1 uncharacterized protein LOC113757196 isoform X2 [Coffea eugenioides]